MHSCSMPCAGIFTALPFKNVWEMIYTCDLRMMLCDMHGKQFFCVTQSGQSIFVKSNICNLLIKTLPSPPLPSPPLRQAKFFIPELKGFLISCKNGNNQEVDEEAHATDPLLLHGEDTDVFSERKRVLTGQTAENDVVIIKDLHKVTGQAPYQAGLIPSLHSTAFSWRLGRSFT